MGGIFISYRREESLAHAGRLHDNLVDRFGHDQIFMDIDRMQVGLKFKEQIEKAVQDCDVLIAVIGKQRLTIKDSKGHRRLEGPNDFVRLEIKAALVRNIPVIPLLVGGAEIPQPAELPVDLSELAEWQGMTMSDERFRPDTARLIDQLQHYVQPKPPDRLGGVWLENSSSGTPGETHESLSESPVQENCTPGSMSGMWKRGTVKLLRHRQTKGPDTDRLHLTNRATSRLYYTLINPWPVNVSRTPKSYADWEGGFN